MDEVLLVLGVRTVLRALKIIETFPTRLRAPKGLPVKLDVEPFGGEITFLHRDEIIEAHALGRDSDPLEARSHVELRPLSWCLRIIYHEPRGAGSKMRADVAHPDCPLCVTSAATAIRQILGNCRINCCGTDTTKELHEHCEHDCGFRIERGEPALAGFRQQYCERIVERPAAGRTKSGKFPACLFALARQSSGRCWRWNQREHDCGFPLNRRDIRSNRTIRGQPRHSGKSEYRSRQRARADADRPVQFCRECKSHSRRCANERGLIRHYSLIGISRGG